MLSRIKFEIDPLVKEILDQLPKSVWASSNTTFLDPAIGGGQFVKEIEHRLRCAGHSDANITKRVYGCENGSLNIKYAVNRYKLIGNYIDCDFLTKDFNGMKFDVIVGNPPYLKGTWVDFLKKSAELSKKHIIMVSPDGTNTFSTRSENLVEFLKANGIQSKTVCTSYFPNVESGSIVVYNLDKSQPFNENAFVNNSIEGIIVSKVINTQGIKLTSMLSSKRSKEYINAKRHTSKKKGLIKNVESITKDKPVTSWIEPENTTVINGSDYWFVNRYFGKDSDSPVFEFSGKVGISTNVMAVQKINGWAVDDFKKVYLSKLFRFVLDVLRQGGFDTSPRHLKQLVIVKKTGKKLYNHFNLTQEEVDYVEANTN